MPGGPDLAARRLAAMAPMGIGSNHTQPATAWRSPERSDSGCHHGEHTIIHPFAAIRRRGA